MAFVCTKFEIVSVEALNDTFEHVTEDESVPTRLDILFVE